MLTAAVRDDEVGLCSRRGHVKEGEEEGEGGRGPNGVHDDVGGAVSERCVVLVDCLI